MNTLKKALAWVKTHPAQVKRDVTVIGAALAAQPAVHALVHGQHVTAAAVIAALIGATKIAARKLFTG